MNIIFKIKPIQCMFCVFIVHILGIFVVHTLHNTFPRDGSYNIRCMYVKPF